jgi:hypothetical protein
MNEHVGGGAQAGAFRKAMSKQILERENREIGLLVVPAQARIQVRDARLRLSLCVRGGDGTT